MFLSNNTFKYSVLLLLCVIATGSAQQKVGGFNVYYGSLHNHTNVSDDAVETPLQAYTYAKEVSKMDFLGLSDHAHATTSTEWNDTQNSADQVTENGKFVAFRGFEWSHSNYGHVSVVNSSAYTTRDLTTNFSDLVKWLEANDAIAFLNHPGRQNGGGNEFNNFNSTPSEKVVGIELWNQSQGYENYYYTNGYNSTDGGLGYFEEAQIKGWKIGAAGSGDNHGATWGTRNDNRLAILATELTRDALYASLKKRQFFSTMDKNIGLSFKMDGNQMGSVIKTGSHQILIEANDGDGEIFTQVKLFKKGILLASWNPNSKTPILTYTVPTSSNGDFFHVKVTQQDGEEAISSPIYISSSAISGISKTTTATIASGSDDAEEDKTGVVRLTSNDIELVYDGTSRGDQTIGLRFTDLNIPQGASITNAYIQFTAMGESATYSLMTIKGEKAANSATFTDSNNNISGRTKTQASAVWGPFYTVWTEGEAGTNQKSADIKTVIQEIVNQGGYTSNSAVSLIITGIGEKRAYAFETDANKASKLVVEYVSDSNNTAPSTSITNIINGSIIASGGAITIQAVAADTDGTISKVKFYNGGTLLGEDTTAPYTYIWATAPDGKHNLVVKATDNSGATTTSTSVNITISANAVPVFGVASRIGQASDDAEENTNTGSVSTSSTDIDLSYNQDASVKQLVGLRFQNLNIPQGSNIESAYVQFWVSKTASTACALKFYGENADHSSEFKEINNNLSGRSKTSNFVNWNVANWDKWSDGGVKQQTPDITSIIQEIVSRPNYSEANAIALLLEGTNNNTRVAVSYEAYQLEKREGQAAKLFVTYSGALPSTTYAVKTTEPTIYQNGCATIQFDASKGNAGLKGFSGDVYAHTGLITQSSTSQADWKFNTTWGTNTSKYKLTSLGNDKYELKIDNLRQFYGVGANDQILKLNFVFRNGSGTITGRDTFGGDLFIDVSDQDGVDCNTLSTENPISKSTNLDFVIFPNPNRGIFTISNNNSNKTSITVKVFSAAGQLVYNKKHYSGDSINLSTFTNGTYLVKVTDENGVDQGTKKIILKK